MVTTTRYLKVINITQAMSKDPISTSNGADILGESRMKPGIYNWSCYKSKFIPLTVKYEIRALSNKNILQALEETLDKHREIVVSNLPNKIVQNWNNPLSISYQS